MNTLIGKTQSKPQTVTGSMVSSHPQRGSVARWFLENGKLTCKWFPADQ
jgi:hypothetical protein